ncbi:MAG: hypothetical protein M3N14_10535 [Bacteroidota bacterium]|nr:hypothetical protein [Bacteroidota bacterium]
MKPDSITARRNYWASIGFGPSSLGFAGLNVDVNAQILKHWVVSAELQEELQSLRLSNHPSAQLNTFSLFAEKYSSSVHLLLPFRQGWD